MASQIQFITTYAAPVDRQEKHIWPTHQILLEACVSAIYVRRGLHRVSFLFVRFFTVAKRSPYECSAYIVRVFSLS